MSDLVQLNSQPLIEDEDQILCKMDVRIIGNNMQCQSSVCTRKLPINIIRIISSDGPVEYEFLNRVKYKAKFICCRTL